MAPYQFRDFYIPDRMMAGLRRYVSHGIEPGSFLTALLRNDFLEAVRRADDENLANLPAYAAWLYEQAPAPCHGSPEKVAAWIEFCQARVPA